MGRVIAKKIRGMNLWVKVGLVTTLTLLVSVFMYQGWYKPNSAQAASVTRYFMQNNGTSVGADGTTNWVADGATRPTIDLLGSPAPATSDRSIPVTVNGTNTLMYRAYSPAITSNTNIAANATTTVYLRDNNNVTDSSTVTVRLYDYDPNGVAGNGTLIGTATVATNVNIPGAATAYTGTLNNGSYALTALAVNPKRLRMEVWINTNQNFGLRIYSGGTTASSITTDECSDSTPSTITIASSQTANGSPYVVSGMKTTTGNVGTLEYMVTKQATTTGTCQISGTGSYYFDAKDYTAAGNNFNTTGTYLVGVTNDTAAPPTGNPVEYSINFTQAGTYYVHILSSGTGLSWWYGLDGTMVGNSEATAAGWTWRSAWFNTGPNPMAITVSTPGTHVFNLWSREPNSQIDGIIITADAAFTPAGTTEGSTGGASNIVTPDVGCTVTTATTCTNWQSSASIPATTAGGSLCGDYTNGGTYTLDVRGTDPDCGVAVATTPTNFIWNSTTAPTLTSPTATSVAGTTATLGANVTADGGAAITARGTVWGIAAAPAVNSLATSGTTGVFTQARTGLTAGTKIYYRGYATNSAGTAYSPDGSFYTEPATQASGLTFTGVGPTGMTVNWTRGSGGGVIVLMKATSAVNSNPVDGTYTGYTANTVFGSGTQIGTGNYVVYKSTGTSVAVTGLTAGTTYHVAVYEYAGAVNTAGVDQGTNYLLGPITGSQIAVVPPPPTVTTPITPNNAMQGTTNLNVSITGTNFMSGCVASFTGGGITVNSTTWNSSTSVTANIGIAAGATPGSRNITVTNPDAQAGTGTGLFTVNAGTCTANAPTVTLGADASVTKGQQTSYTLSITNNDTAFCGNTTFTSAIGTESGNTASFVLPSVLGSTSTGALAPGATYNTTLTVKAQAAGTVGHTLTSQVNVSGAGHTTQSDSAITTIVSSWAQNNLLHNSTNATNISKATPYWNANGGWGLPGTKYGAFDCTTCHIPGSANISRVKVTLTAPSDTFPGSAVLFQSKTTKNDAVNPSFGVYSTAITSSKQICEVCHSQTTYHRQNMTAVVSHENKAQEVDCIVCHKHNQGFKAIGGCTICHKLDQRGKRTAVFGQFSGSSAMSHHIQGVPVTDKQCYQCHWEANSDGTVNLTYHDMRVSGAPVNLVIQGALARPTVYTEGTTGITYSANTSRTELAKINNHCLSCHNTANDAYIPFGDGKTPKQYAWDGKSVESRYSDATTTRWGKYNPATYPRVSPKYNQTKALSAHGRADLNQRGWNTTETWPNTSGSAAVLCYDCHNSHGSSVTGTTTSYASATNNGGLLKDTKASRGGYAMAYKPTAGGSAATKDAYNPGAGLCFNCHENTNGTTMPWTYNTTFGATQDIRGYFDTAYFSAPGTGAANFGPSQRYTYKGSNNTHKGGHFGASSGMSTTATKPINGLCTPCHDPHGVSTTIASRDYAVPLLKGTWMSSPYKEDVAPVAPNGLTGATGIRGGGDQPGSKVPTVATNYFADGLYPRYYLDQNTFGPETYPVQGLTNNISTTGPRTSIKWDFANTTARVAETPAQFAGLCLGCHPQASIAPNAASTAPAWKTYARVHNTVKGWGSTGTGNAGNAAHSYTCSKCHTVHNSKLPRLMVTNCLNYNHRNQVASNATNPVKHSMRSNSGQGGGGGFPSGGGGRQDTKAKAPPSTQTGGFYGEWFFGSKTAPTGYRTCHDVGTAGGTTGYPANQLWNNLTTW